MLDPTARTDYSSYFDQIGAYASFGDQSSRRENFDYLVNYGDTPRPVFQTMTSGEWYRSTTNRGRWAIDLEAVDCQYPEDERRLQGANDNPDKDDNGNGNKDRTWRFDDDRPMPSATESIDGGVQAIVPRLAVPRFVNAAGVATCRTREWLDGGWALADQTTYDNRSTKTRNHNRCGDGKTIYGLGDGPSKGFTKQYDTDNVRGATCFYG